MFTLALKADPDSETPNLKVSNIKKCIVDYKLQYEIIQNLIDHQHNILFYF